MMSLFSEPKPKPASPVVSSCTRIEGSMCKVRPTGSCSRLNRRQRSSVPMPSKRTALVSGTPVTPRILRQPPSRPRETDRLSVAPEENSSLLPTAPYRPSRRPWPMIVSSARPRLPAPSTSEPRVKPNRLSVSMPCARAARASTGLRNSRVSIGPWSNTAATAAKGSRAAQAAVRGRRILELRCGCVCYIITLH